MTGTLEERYDDQIEGGSELLRPGDSHRDLPTVCYLALEAGAWASPPERAGDMGADGANCRALAAVRQDHSRLAAETLHRQTPEVGGECVSSTRSDLSGGRPVTGVPTGMNRNAVGA